MRWNTAYNLTHWNTLDLSWFSPILLETRMNFTYFHKSGNRMLVLGQLSTRPDVYVCLKRYVCWPTGCKHGIQHRACFQCACLIILFAFYWPQQFMFVPALSISTHRSLQVHWCTSVQLCLQDAGQVGGRLWQSHEGVTGASRNHSNVKSAIGIARSSSHVDVELDTGFVQKRWIGRENNSFITFHLSKGIPLGCTQPPNHQHKKNLGISLQN